MQMWHLLNDKITVMEGFRFLGLGPVKERIEVNLCNLQLAEGLPGKHASTCMLEHCTCWHEAFYWHVRPMHVLWLCRHFRQNRGRQADSPARA